MNTRISDMQAGTPPYSGDTLLELSVPTGGVPAYATRRGTKKDILQPTYIRVTGDAALSVEDSGSVIHNYGAPGTVQVFLPPALALDPSEFEFSVTTALPFGPVALGSDIIIGSGSSLTSSTLGSNVKLRCIVDGQWIVAYATGSWG